MLTELPCAYGRPLQSGHWLTHSQILGHHRRPGCQQTSQRRNEQLQDAQGVSSLGFTWQS